MPLVKRCVRPPTSGSEIPFSLQPWVSLGKMSNNCYAYAVNDFDFFRVQKSSPGNTMRVNNRRLPQYNTIEGLQKRMLLDNPKKIYKTTACTKCRKGFYKIMMFAAMGGGDLQDFHYYKQHSMAEYRVKPSDTFKKLAAFFKVPVDRIKKASGGPLRPGHTIKFRANFWSHKRGYGTGPLLEDARGRPIRNPIMANRSYPGLNYSTYGGSFCVKNKGIQVGKTYM
jgi:hypothetical protein